MQFSNSLSRSPEKVMDYIKFCFDLRHARQKFTYYKVIQLKRRQYLRQKKKKRGYLFLVEAGKVCYRGTLIINLRDKLIHKEYDGGDGGVDGFFFVLVFIVSIRNSKT